MICKKKGHGEYTGNQCPFCCLHKGQIKLNCGPICGDCNKPVLWVTANQLENIEAQLNDAYEALSDHEGDDL